MTDKVNNAIDSEDNVNGTGNSGVVPDDGLDIDTVLIPGPELAKFINKLAARFITKHKGDDTKMHVFRREILSSEVYRHKYLWLDEKHKFYPFFIARYNEFKNNPENALEYCNKAKQSSSSSDSGGNSANSGGNLVKKKRLEQMISVAQMDAKKRTADPHPNFYMLSLPHGMSIPREVFDIMSLTAQYVAKYGTEFESVALKGNRPIVKSVSGITTRYNSNFSFLSEDNPAHEVYKGLVQSYRQILYVNDIAGAGESGNNDINSNNSSGSNNVEDRLEVYELMNKEDELFNRIIREKREYLASKAARRKVALLTDSELKAKLNWDTFTVVKTITIEDLGFVRGN